MTDRLEARAAESPCLRAATEQEAGILTELAMRSKAHWGYSDAFMERCRPLLTVTPDYVRQNHPFVACVGDTIRGLYALRESNGELELDLLFVDPGHMGSGVGAELLAHALERAASMGHSQLVVESDPQAEQFYIRMGAIRIGERSSAVEAGRRLPLLAFGLTRRAARTGPVASSR